MSAPITAVLTHASRHRFLVQDLHAVRVLRRVDGAPVKFATNFGAPLSSQRAGSATACFPTPAGGRAPITLAGQSGDEPLNNVSDPFGHAGRNSLKGQEDHA